MKRFFLTLAVAAAMFTGCAIQAPVPTAPVVEVIETTEYMESTARVLEPKQKMLLTTLIADLKVSEQKVYYTETEAFAKFKVTPTLLKNITELKKIAVSRAASAHKADVLVGTTIDVVTKDGRLEITVSGYPAFYTKFRNVAEKDIALLKSAQSLDSKDGADVVKAPVTHLNVDVKK